jgi:hypothetical protein
MSDDKLQQPSAAVRQVIKELESCYSHAGGPKKEAASASIFTADSDPENNDITAQIDVHFYQESPWGDCGGSESHYTLTLADVRYLAQHAPELRDSFDRVAQKMDAQLKTDREPLVRRQQAREHAENVQAIGAWCDQGLPTQSATGAMRPLKFKGRSFMAW